MLGQYKLWAEKAAQILYHNCAILYLGILACAFAPEKTMRLFDIPYMEMRVNQRSANSWYAALAEHIEHLITQAT